MNQVVTDRWARQVAGPVVAMGPLQLICTGPGYADGPDSAHALARDPVSPARPYFELRVRAVAAAGGSVSCPPPPPSTTASQSHGDSRRLPVRRGGFFLSTFSAELFL